MEQAASELIRALRGRRSQRAFARRLGYRSNVLAPWEAGRRFPTAAEFLRAAGRAGVDVPGAFARFHHFSAAALGEADDAGVAAWLSALRGTTPIGVVAARVGKTRFAVGRWLSGQTRPRLPDFLRLVQAMTDRVADLAAELVPIERVPSLAEAHRKREAARALAFAEPWSEAVLRILETRAYRDQRRHIDGWIAEQLGITPEDERRILTALVDAGIIEMRGGTYTDAGPLTVDTAADPDATRALKQHWATVAARAIPADPDAPGMFAYNVMSLSEGDLERVAEILRVAFRDIRSVVAATPAEEVAALLNVQLVPWPR